MVSRGLQVPGGASCVGIDQGEGRERLQDGNCKNSSRTILCICHIFFLETPWRCVSMYDAAQTREVLPTSCGHSVPGPNCVFRLVDGVQGGKGGGHRGLAKAFASLNIIVFAQGSC